MTRAQAISGLLPRLALLLTAAPAIFENVCY
jgi:hypothetical protein